MYQVTSKACAAVDGDNTENIMKRYSLIAFDLDGTLLDSKDGIASAFNASLKACRYPEVDPAQVHHLIGLPLDVMYAQIFNRTVSQVEFARLLAAYADVYQDQVFDMTTVMPGAAKLLEALNHRGVRLTVATSKGPSTAKLLDHLGLRRHFALVVTRDMVAHPKPHPDMLHYTLKTLAIKPHESLMVGDTIYDMEMGQSAAVDTCGITHGSHDREKLMAVSPTYIVDSYSEILDLIGRQRYNERDYGEVA